MDAFTSVQGKFADNLIFSASVKKCSFHSHHHLSYFFGHPVSILSSISREQNYTNIKLDRFVEIYRKIR